MKPTHNFKPGDILITAELYDFLPNLIVKHIGMTDLDNPTNDTITVEVMKDYNTNGYRWVKGAILRHMMSKGFRKFQKRSHIPNWF